MVARGNSISIPEPYLSTFHFPEQERYITVYYALEFWVSIDFSTSNFPIEISPRPSSDQPRNQISLATKLYNLLPNEKVDVIMCQL